MKTTSLLLLLIATFAAPLAGQTTDAEVTGRAPESRISISSWSDLHPSLANPMPHIYRNAFLDGPPDLGGAVPIHAIFLSPERRPKDRWCGAGWGAGLGGFAGFAYGLASTLWDDSLAPLAWMIVLPPMTATVGAVVGAIIGC